MDGTAKQTLKKPKLLKRRQKTSKFALSWNFWFFVIMKMILDLKFESKVESTKEFSRRSMTKYTKNLIVEIYEWIWGYIKVAK